MDDLLKTREEYRAQIRTALEEDPDPLSAYDSFVKWTLEHYPKHNLAQSGLLELLEEATRQFKDDEAYKGDLRYLKLWLLYANHVEDPSSVHAYLLKKNIGAVYAQTYWEYATALECAGRRPEAEAVYQKGIQRRARPLEPLKRRYEDFKKRTQPPLNVPSANATFWKGAPSSTRALRRNPFKNHTSEPSTASTSAPPSAPPTVPSSHASSAEDQKRERYALMLAPPVPGKRPEKLRFNLSLLFTEDGTEYSMQEARARSMGLLGKKWAPPPEAASSSTSARVNFNDGPGAGAGTGRTRTTRKAFEPTVTLATKEALADVFGMYNSPERSVRLGAVVGSKHAPVHKVAPVSLESQFRAVTGGGGGGGEEHVRNDENAGASLKTPRANNENAGVPPSKLGAAFRPFVDENAGRKENSTPAPPPKFKPFVDDEQPPPPPPSKLPTLTPNPGRKALTLKDASTPGAPAHTKDELAQSTKTPVPFRPAPVFSVFTPAADPVHERPAAARKEAGSEQPLKASSASPPELGGAVFTPFRDAGEPIKVFSRPSTRNENRPAVPPEPAPAPASTFKPFVDNAEEEDVAVAPAPAPVRKVLGERTPLRAAFAPPPEPVDDEPEEPEEASQLEDSYEEDSDDYDYNEPVPAEAELVPLPSDEGEGDSMFDDGEDLASRATPLGGRFGKFDVMTPIAERTLEYAASTRSTPNDTRSRPVAQRDAVEAAEQLAAELREEEEAERNGAATGVAELEERTGTMSLSDALAITSSFQPPNPCNPFDPPVVRTLLSLIPPDSAFHDLKTCESARLDAMQRFAKKQGRKSGGPATKGAPDPRETCEVGLGDRRFSVVGKLGEGGFGAVFEAVDLDKQAELDDAVDDSSESDEDEDADGDAEDQTRFALKVVRPRNLWEFHVLRRIHRTLPSALRRSLITPHTLYAFRDESFLVLELRKQGTLLDVVNRAGTLGVLQAGGGIEELLVIYFAIELLRVLEGLHRAGFIHGDVKIDNCLLRLEDGSGGRDAWPEAYDTAPESYWRGKGIKLIDFGRTIDTRLFPAGQQYIAEWPTDARDCLEIREGRPWTFQTDYFGLAGILYCLLYGKYIDASSVTAVSDDEKRYKIATPMKRYWQTDLWTKLFDLLLNPCLVREDGQLPLNDEVAELRVEMEEFLRANSNKRASGSLKQLMKKLEKLGLETPIKRD